VNPVPNSITIKELAFVAAELYCYINHCTELSLDSAMPRQHGTVAHFHIFPLFQQLVPAETDRMLDPKRSPSFCNAFTGKKGHIQILSQKMISSFILDLKNNFIILVLCTWAYKGRGNRGVELLHNEELNDLSC
jgi:hypothetical protein